MTWTKKAFQTTKKEPPAQMTAPMQEPGMSQGQPTIEDPLASWARVEPSFRLARDRPKYNKRVPILDTPEGMAQRKGKETRPSPGIGPPALIPRA